MCSLSLLLLFGVDMDEVVHDRARHRRVWLVLLLLRLRRRDRVGPDVQGRYPARVPARPEGVGVLEVPDDARVGLHLGEGEVDVAVWA